MQIRVLTPLAGTEFSLSPGDITDRFDEADAKRLIAAGYAEPVVELPAAAAKRQARARTPRTEQR